MRVFFMVLMLAILPALSINKAQAQEKYWSKEFADAILDRYNNINDLTGKGWEYSNSIVLIGIEKLYYETGDLKYLVYLKKYIDRYINSNGDISFDPSSNNLDHLHPGWLCITLYEELGIEKYKIAADNIRDEFDNQPRNPSGGFWHKNRYANQMWADGIYMAEPFLMRYGAAFNDLSYASDEATKQATMLFEHAYDSTKHLLYHGWDETKEATWADPTTGVSPEVWSRGMGWYCMALVDMLDYLPKAHKKYTDLVTISNELAVGIKNYQDAQSGLWYQVVDKGDLNDNWLEVSGSSMFVYFLKKAVDNHYIDSATYMPVAIKGWDGVKSKITLDNNNQPVINEFVRGMGIKDSYEAYVSEERVSTPNSRYPHGYCGVLLAATQMEFPLPTYYSLETNTSGNGEVSLSETSNEYIIGSEVQLTAVPDNEWEFAGWTGDTVTSNNPITITLKKDYSVTANFGQLTSMEKMDADEKLTIYPTVVIDELYVKLPNTEAPMHLVIINMQGKVIREISVHSNPIVTLDLAGLWPGDYIILARNNHTNYSNKFLKK